MQTRQDKTETSGLAAKPTESIRKTARGSGASGRQPAWTSAWGDHPPAGLVASVADLQAKRALSQPGDPSEQEADHIADQVMRMTASGVSMVSVPPDPPKVSSGLVTSMSHVPPMIQRATFKEGTTSAPPAAESTSETTPTSATATAESAPGRAAPSETPTPGLIVDDTMDQLGPGQMKKSDFLAQLRSAVCTTTEQALAGTIWSAAGCPWVDHWFGYYNDRDSQQIERAVRRYAPETANVTSASDYIPIICERVRSAIAVWSTTGEITGVPEGMELPGGGLMGVASSVISGIASVGSSIASGIASVGSSVVSGVGSALSSIGSLFFKSREGGAREAGNPQAIQGQLGTGRSLDGGVRSHMESAFGVDFSQVRIHNDATAADLSERLNARALTIGQDVAFGPGEYQPGTLFGDALIAHELAHVVQQGGANFSELMQKGDVEYGSLEEDADIAAIGAVASTWNGTKGALKDISRNAVPRLKTGFRLQACRRKPASTDFQIRGKYPDAVGEPMKIYFTQGDSTLDAAESAKIPAIATPPGRSLTLNGYASEEEVIASPALIDARITAVDTALSAAGHTGTRTRAPKPADSSGQINYRSVRVVEVVPVGGVSSIPSCAGGSVIPCGPAPNPFTTAATTAETLLANAITALSAPPLAPTTASLLTSFFGGVAAAPTVKTNLIDLKNHIHLEMMPAAGHECANLCDSDCAGSDAYNRGTGAAAKMTLCPSFMSEPDVKNRAGILVHEGAHGTAGLATKDKAYAHERLITFLSTADALKNSDSYVLFVRLLDAPGSITVGPAVPDVLTGMSSAEETAVHRTVAWLEKWLIWASLYGTIPASIAAGSWTNTYYRATMGLVAPRFGLTMPPAVPVMSDQIAVAAIHDRYHQMRETMHSSPITVNKISSGTETWAPGPGSTVTVTSAFFGLSPRAQLDRLLEKIVLATPDISSGLVPKYIELVDEIRKHKGGGSP